MTNTHITAADLEELRINNRQPRVERVLTTRAEVIEALGRKLEVNNLAELQHRRNALSQTIASVMGVTIKQIKMPQAHITLRDDKGVALTSWERDQRQRVRAGGRFTVELAGFVRQGVLSAWEAKR